MMKKQFIAIFLLLTATLVGDSCSKSLVDFNVGYFRPFSKTLRDVLSGGVNYQLQVTYKWDRHFGVFASGDYFYKKGNSTGDGAKTSLWIVPFTVGLRAFADIWECPDRSAVLQAYGLIGPRWYFVRATNSASYVNHHNNAQGIGGVAGFGFDYLYDHLTINTFVNYSIGTVKASSSKHNVKAQNTQVGGIVIGAGLGWNF